MANTSKRIKGKAEEIGGRIKGAVGGLLGNEQMQVEGKAKAAKGMARQEVAKAGERIKGGVEELAGKAKKAVGGLVDNEQMKLEGKAKELKGKARQAGNR
jgi:uncharacterized protein YjbJ (UPF0337 family)